MSFRSLQRNTRRLIRQSAKILCTCRPQTSTLGYLSGMLALTCVRTFIHNPQCPQSAFQTALTNLQFRATLCSLILRTKASLSFTLSYGAGFSVTHTLQCHHIVESSPAFAFIKPLVESSINMPEETFRGEIDKLFAMFQLRQASPHDRLPNGSTLLHVSMSPFVDV
jgi:hypothetical protein